MRRIPVFAVVMMVVATAFGLYPSEAQEVPTEPLFEVERLFVQLDWANGTAPDAVRRIRPRFTLGKGRCLGRLELDLAKTELVNGGNANWLEIGELVCNTSATSQMHVGRLFLSPPYSTPYPGALRTIEYAGAIPFSAFAYGIQWQLTQGKWWVSADLTGDSGRQFDDLDFTRLESGLRIVRTTGLGAFGFTSQLSDQFVRLGLDYNTDSKEAFGLWVGLYYNDAAPKREVTGLVLVSHKLGSRLRPHVMYDWRPNGREMLTVGTEYQWTEQLRLVGDCEVNSERFLLRTQFKF